jgi:exopolyphosphatase/guanosine-5'-triphosphate,3'-diphosphate pyrophosphatase
MPMAPCVSASFMTFSADIITTTCVIRRWRSSAAVIRSMSARAGGVEATALSVLTQLAGGAPAAADLQFLSWAARLHEIGISVAHNAYHKHGAYILTYADMPGFSKRDQARLAMLVLAHRGTLDKLRGVPAVDAVWRLIFSLRLAVLLHRTRDDRALPAWRVAATSGGFRIDMPAGWLVENPWDRRRPG